MADELKTLVAQGLQALKAGGEVAKRATAEIQGDASDPGLKSALQASNKTAEGWAQRVQEAVRDAGPAEDTGNPILEAHYEVSKKIRQKAPDAITRDLGIIAAGQLALHYWIAAFGTLRTYTAKAGMMSVQGSMQACLDEAKQSDERYNDVALKIMNVRA
jgi:ferritin-like metal-binding protein YciE